MRSKEENSERCEGQLDAALQCFWPGTDEDGHAFADLALDKALKEWHRYRPLVVSTHFQYAMHFQYDMHFQYVHSFYFHCTLSHLDYPLRI